MSSVPKAAQIVHRSIAYAGPKAIFGVNPVDQGLAFPEEDPILGSGEWMANVDPDTRGVNDLRLISANAQGNGWTFEFEAKGSGTTYEHYQAGRGIGAHMYELKEGADSVWQCWAKGRMVAAIIQKRGGVQSDIGPNGENTLSLTAATPDAFLDEHGLPQMPYLARKPVEAERQAWKHMIATGRLPGDTSSEIPTTIEAWRIKVSKSLGYDLRGIGKGGFADQIFVDPFAGFANIRDNFTISEDQVMDVVPANEKHIFSVSNIQKGAKEIFAHHVKVNGEPIGKYFQLNFQDDGLESNVLHYELSGSPNNALDTAAANGVYRWWWDSLSRLHFQPDYSNLRGNQIKVALHVAIGRSMIGHIKIGPGSKGVRVNRAAVRGQPFASFDTSGITDPTTASGVVDGYYSALQGATYPSGANLTGEGTVITQENYVGERADEQASRLFRQAESETTFTWTGFPDPLMAAALFNRVIEIRGKDPKGDWDFTFADSTYEDGFWRTYRPFRYRNSSAEDPTAIKYGSCGKLFVVTNVSIQLQHGDRPGGGYYSCTLAGREIILVKPGVFDQWANPTQLAILDLSAEPDENF